MGYIRQASTSIRGIAVATLLVTLPFQVHASEVKYEYDALGRVVKVIHGDQSSVAYAYDAAGNRTQSVKTASGGANRPPVANPDSATVVLNDGVEIYVIGNDYDPDGDPITVVSTSNPRRGFIGSVGPYIYYVSDNDGNPYSGPDNFTYTISDGRGGTATATIFLTVVN